MAIDYAEIAADALEALQDAGFSMTLRKASGGTYDEATGITTGGTTTDYTAMGIDLAPTITKVGDDGQRFNGFLVLADDRFLLIAASGLAVVPVPGDLLVIDGVIYSIVTLVPVRPGGVDLLYRTLVRK